MACAGVRVGYGAFPAGLIDYIWRAKQPYNVSVTAETAACAALTDAAYMQVSHASWVAPCCLLSAQGCSACAAQRTGMRRPTGLPCYLHVLAAFGAGLETGHMRRA